MRSSGILLHITSLPSAYGIGDLGPQAYAFVDFLEHSGQRFWQVLPVNPTDGINGHSPYSCFSAFAGNPLMISPDLMVIDGFLKPGHLRKGVPKFISDRVDYAPVAAFKEKLFKIAFHRFRQDKDHNDFRSFASEHRSWLEDFAVFVVAKNKFQGKSWNEWPIALRHRRPQALKAFVKANNAAIEQVKFVQYLFFKQWRKLKEYANSRQVRVIGDIPIYVNYDSAEVWTNPRFFKLNADESLKFVSGCPPDYFSKTGQRWGNPVYDWAVLKKDRYDWWVKRIGHNLGWFDSLRIDHFRGFSSFWQIPAHEKLAVFGRWVKGPGKDFFKRLEAQFPHLPLIAEDLGEITPDVIDLMRRFHLPGMRVLLFAFGGDVNTNPHVPAHYIPDCVAYTGTHDNNTVQGWFKHEAKPFELDNLKKVLKQRKIVPKQLHWVMIRVLMRSKANSVIIPLSDVLGLDQEARMNTPATNIGNWQWRLGPRSLTTRLSLKLLKLTKQTKRD